MTTATTTDLFAPLLEFVDRQDVEPRAPDESIVLSIHGIASYAEAEGRIISLTERPYGVLTVGHLRKIAEAIRTNQGKP